MIALSCEHSHRVMEDVTASLYTLIEPTCSMLFFVQGHGEGLPSAVINSINQRDIELVLVLRQMVCSRHASRSGSDHEYLFLAHC